ncbi:hypothetical protein LDO26_16815 [Luteimonas sp. BDR2-5]|uniref:flotillin family protein n=1 Tax=Proluteimonas luteida TaxID=2878685 RepID=UPI001E5B9D39|nr:hypothetical protein [Luteimonas sp. BDR2-5]MCD9029854.1 hypothetical protein [Luteimonas sp. BDR2-5]
MSVATLAPFLIGLGITVIVLLGAAVLFKAFYKKVDQGTALIVNDMSSQPKVRFTGALIIPVLYRAELMKISLITLQIDRRGKEGLICRDNMRADIAVAFYLRVNETQADVLRVAKALGADRASDKHAVDELFNAKFSEALKTVGKKFDFTDLFEKRQEFRDEIIAVIGNDLNGYVLEDVAIDYLEQTPKSVLDPHNILDAEGIRKITELTASQNVVTNELEQNERLAITKKNVETREATLSLERQQAEAEARQQREVETIRAREEAETAKVQEEQRQVAENARIEAQQLIDIREENRLREVEVAAQNRQRAVAIEAERVERARQLEQVTTDREVQLQGVERDKVVEQGKMDVANITRERISIDKTVAQEEERIKEVREVSEADRLKQVTILDAEAKAQEALVRQVKEAEARETAAKHRAVEVTTLAQAEFEAAGKQAEAKKVLSEGVRAEQAAPGLADAQVQEAAANAYEKQGLAEARVIEAKADANLRQGTAEARVLAETLAAQAQGEEQMGRAKATAVESIGLAEASVVEKKLLAEAEGLVKKFQAIDALSDSARGHEEFRMALDTGLKQALASIEAGKEVSRENAEVIATALRNADIDLVGGDGGMFDNLIKAVSLGRSIEGLADKSPVVQELMHKYLGIERGNPQPRADGSAASAG